MWLHKNFNDGGFDLAILQLETPFTFNSNVAAVRLPSAGTILNQNDCRLIGRGTELGGYYLLWHLYCRLNELIFFISKFFCKICTFTLTNSDPVMSERLVWSSVKAFSQSVNSDCQNELAISGITLKPTQVRASNFLIFYSPRSVY